MASARACSKCKDAAGVFNCTGCQKLFCSKHSIEHRQELCARFEHLMTEHNITLEQIQDRKPAKELLKKNFDARIDQWKEMMMAKVCQRAEEIRRELDERLDRQNEAMIKDIRLLAEEIHRRHEKEDFFEQDIERIEQNIKEAQQTIEKSNQQSDIELCIGPDEIVDWEKLIYIQERSDSASSSVTRKETNGITNARHPDREHGFHPSSPAFYIPPIQYYPTAPFISGISRELNPQYMQLIRPPNKLIIPANSSQTPPTYAFSPPSLSEPSASTNSTGGTRAKKSLAIIDPISHKALEVSTSTNTEQNSSQTASVNPKSNSSSAATKSQKQDDFRRDFMRILNFDSNT